MAKVQYTLRIEEVILEGLKNVAEVDRRSLNSQIEYFLENALAERQMPPRSQKITCDCGRNIHIY